MKTEYIKREIESRTGVPASLLVGESAGEVIAQAKALLALRRESDEHQLPQTTQETFAKWFDENYGENEPKEDAANAALNELENSLLGSPVVTDGGEVNDMSDSRPAREQFAEWFDKAMSYDLM